MTVDDAAGTEGAERLNFFSDAVVAIAITLLALDLHVPNGANDADFRHDLVRHADEYLAFFISFAVIGNHWFLHHRVFSAVRATTSKLMRWNMLWLMTIVLTPFATRVIVGDGVFDPRFALYAAVQVLASSLFLFAVREIDHAGLAGDGIDRERFTMTYLRLGIVVGAFLVGIPLVFVIHRWAYACWVAIPVVTRAVTLWRDRRRGAAERDAVPDRA